MSEEGMTKEEVRAVLDQCAEIVRGNQEINVDICPPCYMGREIKVNARMGYRLCAKHVKQSSANNFDCNESALREQIAKEIEALDWNFDRTSYVAPGALMSKVRDRCAEVARGRNEGWK